MTTNSLPVTNQKFTSEDFDRRIILTMLMNILAELKNYDRVVDMVLLGENLKSILNIIEHSASRNNSNFKSDNENLNKFIVFKGILENEFHFKHKVSYYSHKLGLQPAQLSSICLNYIGQSAREMINNRIICESKKLLLSSSLSIKEISGILGFSDQYQFSKYFKKYMTTAPLFYRNSLS